MLPRSPAQSDIQDVGPDDRGRQVREVLLHRERGVLIALDRRPDLVAGLLDAQVESAGAGEDADGDARVCVVVSVQHVVGVSPRYDIGLVRRGPCLCLVERFLQGR